MKTLAIKKEQIRNDLHDLEKIIFPKYKEAASNIPVQRADAKKHYQKLTTTLTKEGEALHKETDTIIQEMQSEIYKMVSQHIDVIDKNEKEIIQAITEIEKSVDDIKALLDSGDFYFVSNYKSRNEEFRRLPAQCQVTLPTFTSQEINRKQLHQQFGSLSKLILTTTEEKDPMKTADAKSSPSARTLINEPRIFTIINKECGEGNSLCMMSCLSDSKFWTCGWDKFLRLYSLRGELLKSVRTKAGTAPMDISVTQSQDLVYTDSDDRSINIVRNAQIQPLIKLQGWIPTSLSCTSSGDLLVTMVSDNKQQSKVVRYSGSTEKQSIQWDDQGLDLYSSSDNRKCVSENRNLDICVADFSASAITVVSETGKFRFRYNGLHFTTKRPFKPYGITTDSQGKILTTDPKNDRIHILDQDGHVLGYIDNCDLKTPMGLCLDSCGNLFVVEYSTHKVKKIQYFK